VVLGRVVLLLRPVLRPVLLRVLVSTERVFRSHRKSF
jgi:hypothetical protein